MNVKQYNSNAILRSCDLESGAAGVYLPGVWSVSAPAITNPEAIDCDCLDGMYGPSAGITSGRMDWFANGMTPEATQSIQASEGGFGQAHPNGVNHAKLGFTATTDSERGLVPAASLSPLPELRPALARPSVLR